MVNPKKDKKNRRAKKEAEKDAKKISAAVFLIIKLEQGLAAFEKLEACYIRLDLTHGAGAAEQYLLNEEGCAGWDIEKVRSTIQQFKDRIKDLKTQLKFDNSIQENVDKYFQRKDGSDGDDEGNNSGVGSTHSGLNV
jgi:hypothetical protein